jgi:hypothetical protein
MFFEVFQQDTRTRHAVSLQGNMRRAGLEPALTGNTNTWILRCAQNGDTIVWEV